MVVLLAVMWDSWMAVLKVVWLVATRAALWAEKWDPQRAVMKVALLAERKAVQTGVMKAGQ